MSADLAVGMRSVWVDATATCPFHANRLVVCLYSKSGGQASRHSAVTDSSIVTALSHIGVQVFGHSRDRWFTHVPEETAQLQTRRFAILLPENLLTPTLTRDHKPNPTR